MMNNDEYCYDIAKVMRECMMEEVDSGVIIDDDDYDDDDDDDDDDNDE